MSEKSVDTAVTASAFTPRATITVDNAAAEPQAPAANTGRGWSARPDWLRFPNPVNEYAARFTAGLVVLLSIATIVVDQWWLYLVLALGFLARVIAGPHLSPFGQLSVRVLAPRVGPAKLVAGPPKRFAQAVGLTFSTVALVLSLLGYGLAAQIVIGLLIVAATLESVFGICLGCITFGFLQRRGVIPESVCESCNNWRASAA